jgi:hypothetical protein
VTPAFADAEAALPWADRTVDQLDDGDRQKIGSYWQGRATAELEVADAFTQLGTLLTQSGAEAAIVTLLARSIENERLHSHLCRRMAERYTGRELDPPVPTPRPLPALERASPEARAAIHAAGLCCVNESIATVWLDRCAALASSPLARAVNQLHLADEVFHARLGWAHLASAAVTPAVRAEVGRWLPALLESSLAQWLGPEVTLQTGGVPAHGLPSEDEHRQAVLGAVRHVVLPGFQHCAVDTTAAQRWFEARFAPATTGSPAT